MRVLAHLRNFAGVLPAAYAAPAAPAVAKPTQQQTTGHDNKLWVVCAYFNPCNYENRRTNYALFAARLRAQGVPLCTVEMAASEAQLQLAHDSHNSPLYVPVISPDVLWAKECLLNIGIRALPATCEVVVWADADLVWQEDDWAARTLQALSPPQNNSSGPTPTPVIVQPFEFATNMREGERYETHYCGKTPSGGTALPLGKAYVQRPTSYMAVNDIYRAHAGYAWAARREILERIGGLYEHCILGHADYVMAVAFSHHVPRDGPMGSVWSDASSFNWGPELLAHARAWQAAAADVVQGRLGYVPGVTLFHNWHGDPRDRQYRSRGRIIADFDPVRDLVRLHTPAGRNMLAWSPAAHARGLPALVRQYFENRKEDGQTDDVRAQRALEDARIAQWRQMQQPQ